MWLAEGEPARLAAALDMDLELFRARFVRTVPDPTTGVLRAALRDEGGRCALLEGKNHCSVYEARPEHCSSFPHWPSVLTDRAAFERAREVCPGIAVEVPAETRARAFSALEQLYAEVDLLAERSGSVCILRGACCRFEDAGHRLFATALEADYARERVPDAPAPEAPGRCPYHVAGRCTARAGRPLACRTYYCDTRTESALRAAHEHFLARLRAIERETGYPVSYAEFPALLRARGVGAPEGDPA